MTESELEAIEFAEFSFDMTAALLSRRGRIVPLEPVASRVLRYLLVNHGRLVPKSEILDAVWPDVFTTEDVLKRAISQIRRALGEDAKNSRFLETHHRRGYRFMTGQAPAQVSPTATKPTLSEFGFECFIGREKEFELLKTEFLASETNGGRALMILGDPGIGKTLTALRFAAWAENERGAVLLRTRFFDYEASFRPPFDVFLELLTTACSVIFESTDIREIFHSRLGVELPNELFSATANGTGRSSQPLRAVASIAAGFEKISRIRPLLIVFDDLQWADETSLRVIGHLMKLATDAPLMILALARRGEVEDHGSTLATWLRNEAAYRSFRTLALDPLDVRECASIIDRVFSNDSQPIAVPDADVARLHAATGGNPYFLVETLRLLLNNNGVVRQPDGSWKWHGIDDVPLPETIRMAARAKLATVGDAARELIDSAVILGDTFQIRTLELMLGNDDGNDGRDFDAALDEAIAARILVEQQNGADDCQFYHTTLRRAVDIDLSPRRRKRLHARAVRAIETAHASHPDRYVAAVAAHAESAGDFEKSFALNLRACRAAAARFDWPEAVELIARAERALKNGNLDETPEFLARQGEVYLSVGRRLDAERILAKAAQSIAADASFDAAAAVFYNLGKSRILLGKYRDAVAPLEKSLEIAHATGDANRASAALIQLASARYGLCDYDESCRMLDEVIAADPPGSYNRAVALGKLGWTHALQARYREGRRLLEEALAFHRHEGDLRERAVLAMCLSWCEFGLGNYESAIALANRARDEARIVGEPYNETVAMMRIAKARVAQGFFAEAEESLSLIEDRQRLLDATHARAETIWIRGRARISLGKFDLAARDLATALKMVVKVGDRDDEFRIMIDQADLALELGDIATALEVSAAAAAIAREIGAGDGVGDALVVRARALRANSELDSASETAREAVAILENFESGTRWTALEVLAGLSPDAEAAKILGRVVELLEIIRADFAATEPARSAEFTAVRCAPAKRLAGLLRRAGRDAEADELAVRWSLA